MRFYLIATLLAALTCAALYRALRSWSRYV